MTFWIHADVTDLIEEFGYKPKTEINDELEILLNGTKSSIILMNRWIMEFSIKLKIII